MEDMPAVPAPDISGPPSESQGDLVPDTSAVGQKRAREDEVTAAGEKKWPGWPGDNVFRLIVPVSKVGGIIGRKGELIKKMCEETRSRIKILDGIPGTVDRIVMVSAREEPDAELSPAMDGLLKVHKRVMDGIETEADGSTIMRAGITISSKLLVPVTQAGSLIGRQGITIKSIQDSSGATVRVVSVEEIPLCALPDDRVVEIQGEPAKVQKAMELIIAHLRKFLVDRSILPLFEKPSLTQGQQSQSSWGSSSANSLTNPAGSGLGGLSRYSAPSSGVSSLGGASQYSAAASNGPGLNSASHYSSTSYHSDSYYPTDTYDSQNHHHGVSMYGRDPSITSQVAAPPPAPIITQVTQKMQIPLSYADAIIGTSGANISYMRRTSGATITIQETRGVHGEMTVEIHGTATQVQTAQQLIQNFMAGSSAPVSSYSAVEPYTSYSSQSLYSSGSGNVSVGGYGSSYSGNYGY